MLEYREEGRDRWTTRSLTFNQTQQTNAYCSNASENKSANANAKAKAKAKADYGLKSEAENKRPCDHSRCTQVGTAA